MNAINEIRNAIVCALVFLAVLLNGSVVFSETQSNDASSDPCGFYHGRAHGKGIDHYTTEMLWVCRAIAARRAAAMPVGDRLRATEAAFESYRSEVVAASVQDFARKQDGLTRRLGLSEDDMQRIADRTGVLLALEAVRGGF